MGPGRAGDFDSGGARDRSGEENPPVPAATAVLVRDHLGRLEALMLRRSSKLDFAGGMWVFPGGRVDVGDYPADRSAEAAARRAAVREVFEETGLEVAERALVPFSHWTPPPGTPRRYSTSFFIAEAPDGPVVVDGGEIKQHAWMRPSEAIARRDAGEIELAPPTWVTLHRLARYRDVSSALADSERTVPESFTTRIAVTAEGAVALYHGDAAYEDSILDRPGPRHRLWMLPGAWRYERTP